MASEDEALACIGESIRQVAEMMAISADYVRAAYAELAQALQAEEEQKRDPLPRPSRTPPMWARSHRRRGRG